MSKSIQVRIDKGFERFVIEKQRDYSMAIKKPITFVQATRILLNEYRKGNSNSNVVFYNKRGKRVLL